MELQLQRQQEQEALLAAVPASLERGGVLEVQGLQHLEAILEAASGQLVVLTVYSRWGQAGRQAAGTLAAVSWFSLLEGRRLGLAWAGLREAWQPRIAREASTTAAQLGACLPACSRCLLSRCYW